MIDDDRSAAAVAPSGGIEAEGRGPQRLETPNGPNGARSHADRRNSNAPVAPRRPRGPVYAALDLGTNNCRLLIARPHEKSFRVLDGFTRIVRLGEGLSATGRLSDAAMERTIEALKQCRNKLREHEPARMRLIATEACRSASNGEAFIARVKAELGMDLEIVDRQTEASLAVTGCADLIEEESAGALMFDIGGGSSELAWLDFVHQFPYKLAAETLNWPDLLWAARAVMTHFEGIEVGEVAAQLHRLVIGAAAA